MIVTLPAVTPPSLEGAIPNEATRPVEATSRYPSLPHLTPTYNRCIHLKHVSRCVENGRKRADGDREKEGPGHYDARRETSRLVHRSDPGSNCISTFRTNRMVN